MADFPVAVGALAAADRPAAGSPLASSADQTVKYRFGRTGCVLHCRFLGATTMKVRLILRAVTLCLLAGLLGTAAFATEPLARTNGELGLNLGTMFLDVSSDEILDGGNAIRLDARGGYMFTDSLELEGQYIVAFNSDSDIDADFDMIFINGLFNFHPNQGTVPYVLLGIGQMNADFEAFDTVISDDNSAYQIAIGSRFFFGWRKRMATRVELSAISAELFDEDSFHFSISTGLTWRIGHER